MSLKTYLESLDWLRGISIILMVFINFFDEIVKVSILKAPQGLYIDLAITSLIPNVFITIMGLLLIVNGRFSAGTVAAKAIKLLLLGYIINLLRVPMPQLVGNLLGLTHYQDLTKQAVYHLSMIDIYSFVGYALLLVVPLTYARLSVGGYFALAVFALIAASYGEKLLEWMPDQLETIFSYLFIGEPRNVYFPVFPWIAYLFFGMGLGDLYLRQGKQVFYRLIAWGGALCLAIGLPLFRSHFGPEFSMLKNFYKHDYSLGVVLIGITLLSMVMAEKLLHRLPEHLQRHLAYVSRRIVKMYFFSWIFTGWFVTLHGLNNTFGVCDSIIGATVVYLLSVACLRLWDHLGASPQIEKAGEGTY